MAYAIETIGLGKRYDLTRIKSPQRRLADVLSALPRATARWLRQRGAEERETFWALRDASFTVTEGEAVGIIGRNGAGKSTMLKLFSRITDPTEGRIKLRGRVASLLEVGTGFHPELSGRENIFLNGAILGMRKREIASRLEQIVEFAGVSRFLDEPIKHYSSGMYTRLAFAVAAHLESEILIVDEVLAVGDAAFQNKCLNSMQHAATSGRTVLFVSHNMAAITQLTTRTLLLDQGRVAFDGPTSQATEHYIGVKRHAGSAGRIPAEQVDCSRRWRRNEHLVISELGLAADQPQEIPSGGTVRLELMIRASGPYEGLRVAYTLNGAGGQPLMTGLTPFFSVKPGTHLFELRIDNVNLVPGEYDFSIILGTGGVADVKIECDVFLGFGRLHVSQLMAEGQMFGDWHSAWGAVTHSSCQLRPVTEAVQTPTPSQGAAGVPQASTP